MRDLARARGRPKAANYPAIDGLIKEADTITGEIDDKAVLDAAIVASAQAVEHYEIARYGTLIAWAEELGHDDVVRFLTTNLNEKAANTKLNTVALRKGVSKKPWRREPKLRRTVVPARREIGMILISVKSALLWLVGIPLPIILLIALYLHPG